LDEATDASVSGGGGAKFARHPPGFANLLFYQNKPLIRRGFAMRQPRSVSNGLGEVGESTGLLL